MQISVSEPSRPAQLKRVDSADDEEYNLAYAFAMGHTPSIANAIIQNSTLQEAVLSIFLDKINAECSNLCQSGGTPSAFKYITLPALPQFNWSWFIDELKNKAPLLFGIVSTICFQNDQRNKFKTGPYHNPGMSMAVALLLKERNMHMIGVQSIISLLLFAARVDKQVYRDYCECESLDITLLLSYRSTPG